jgi:Arm DNA-binding domain
VPQGRITKRSVDALKCPHDKDREFLWDDSIGGFGVAAFASGKKVYVAQYRQAGRSRRVTIGEHGRFTPDEARSQAKKLLGLAEGGRDPIAERRQERNVRTFEAVANDFLRLHVDLKRIGLPIIGKLLGHSQAATTHPYAHLDADPMRRAVETIGATISAAMEGTTANVLPFDKISRKA